MTLAISVPTVAHKFMELCTIFLFSGLQVYPFLHPEKIERLSFQLPLSHFVYLFHQSWDDSCALRQCVVVLQNQ